jgi:hypothetical protein
MENKEIFSNTVKEIAINHKGAKKLKVFTCFFEKGFQNYSSLKLMFKNANGDVICEKSLVNCEKNENTVFLNLPSFNFNGQIIKVEVFSGNNVDFKFALNFERCS